MNSYVHPEVRSGFLGFSIPHEALALCMYPCFADRVTTAVGYMIDATGNPALLPYAPALVLPWKTKDGMPASREQIVVEWMAVKKDKSLITKGLHAAMSRAKLFLTKEDALRLTMERFDEFSKKLVEEWYPEMPKWPAPAQLCVMSMAWAMGTGFPKMFPKFSASMRAWDFAAAAGECKIKEHGNPGVKNRNIQNAELLRKAAAAVAPVAPPPPDPTPKYPTEVPPEEPVTEEETVEPEMGVSDTEPAPAGEDVSEELPPSLIASTQVLASKTLDDVVKADIHEGYRRRGKKGRLGATGGVHPCAMASHIHRGSTYFGPCFSRAWMYWSAKSAAEWVVQKKTSPSPLLTERLREAL
jgi:hypothetical protein